MAESGINENISNSNKEIVSSNPFYNRESHLEKSTFVSKKLEPYKYGGVIGDLLTRANELYKDNIAYIFHETDETITFGEIYKQAHEFSSGLVKLGLKTGDRVAIYGTSSLRWVISFWGAIIAGAIVVPINCMSPGPELVKFLIKAGVKAIVCSTGWRHLDYYEILRSISPELSDDANAKKLKLKNLPELKSIIFMDDEKRPGTLTWNKVIRLGKHNKTSNQANPDNPALLLFTSGTTGTPKAVMISHFSLVNVDIPKELQPIAGDGETVLQLIEPPFFGVMCLGFGIAAPLYEGHTICIGASFPHPTMICEAIAKYKVTSVISSVMTLMALLDNKDKFDFSSLRDLTAGGMPVPRALAKKLESVLNVKTRHIYGSTEAFVISVGDYRDIQDMRISNEGLPAPGVEIKIVDPNEDLVGINVAGELYVRSEVGSKGYYDDELKTKETFTDDGWFRTGDLARLDGNGYITVAGRLKDIIIRKGLNIVPYEIEISISTHPKVYDAAVFGVYDEAASTESVAAAVILLPGQNGTAEEIIAFLSNIISDYKIPEYVIFVDKFPKTATGKVKKEELRKLVQVKNTPVLDLQWNNISCVTI